MAERTHNFVETTQRKIRVVAGSFAPDSGNAPTTLRGKDFSVVHTAQGVFTLTFTEPHGQLISATATVQLAAADDRTAQIGTYTAADKTLVIRVGDGAGAGAEQDIAANANNRVNFICVFDDSLTV